MVHVHRVEIGVIFGNQGVLTFYSDSWALISCQTGIYLTIYALNTLKIPDQIHHCKQNYSSIIPCCNASCNTLRICFNGSEMTTCLTHDQINDRRKMPILSEETFLEGGQLFKKNFQSRNLHSRARARLNVRTFGVCLHQKSRNTTREL